jgi:hypothetical protein
MLLIVKCCYLPIVLQAFINALILVAFVFSSDILIGIPLRQYFHQLLLNFYFSEGVFPLTSDRLIQLFPLQISDHPDQLFRPGLVGFLNSIV